MICFSKLLPFLTSTLEPKAVNNYLNLTESNKSAHRSIIGCQNKTYCSFLYFFAFFFHNQTFNLFFSINFLTDRIFFFTLLHIVWGYTLFSILCCILSGNSSQKRFKRCLQLFLRFNLKYYFCS